MQREVVSRRVWEEMEKLQGRIAAEVRVMLGEGPYDQKMFDGAQRDRRIEAMKRCAVESTSPEERHESWMAMHVEDGWTYGPKFIPSEKKHPNLLPWNELPATTRSKAQIFAEVAKAAAKIESRILARIFDDPNDDPNDWGIV